MLAGNKIYAATRDGTVCRIDAGTQSADWKNKLPAEIVGGIGVEKSAFFAGTTDGRLFCLDTENGTVPWSWQCQEKEERALQFFSMPREANGRIYTRAANGFLYCLDTSSGALLWKVDTGSWIRSRPLMIGDSVYVATLDSGLHAMQDEGKQARKTWRRKLGAHGFTADLVGDQNRILLSGRDLILYSISPASSKLQWRHGIIDGRWIDGKFVSAEWVFDFMASPSVVDGTMYVGGPDGFVNAVDVDTGKEKWRYEVGEGLSGLPVVTEGKVFVGQMKGPGRFCALDRETGRLIWESGEFSRVWVASAYHDGMLFFGNMDGDMFGVRASDGTRVWSCYTAKDTPLENIPRGSKFVHGFPPGVYSNPAIDDQNVYVGSWAGYYISLDQKTGKVNWSTKTKPEEGGLPDSAAPMLHKNHLYVQKAGKCIAALHKETGEIAWEWEAPLGYLQNETVAAHGDKIFDSLCVRGYDAAVPCDDHCLRRCGERQKKLWEYDGGGGLTAPIITNDKLTHLWLLG